MKIDISNVTLDNEYVITDKDIVLPENCGFWEANNIIAHTDTKKQLYMVNSYFDESRKIWRNVKPIRVIFIDTNSTVPYNYVINMGVTSNIGQFVHAPHIQILDAIWNGYYYEKNAGLKPLSELHKTEFYSRYSNIKLSKDLAIFTTEKEAKDYIKFLKKRDELDTLRIKLYSINDQIFALQKERNALTEKIEKLNKKLCNK